MSLETLEAQRKTWQRKAVLRTIYETYYERIVACCIPGATLEVGGGSGNLKAFLDDVISTDILATPWIDAAADAQNLPFADASFANVVAVDVLHHIESPTSFLHEALRVLQSDGSLVLLDPAITPISGIFYRLFHPEPVDMSADPYAVNPPAPDRQPFDANQAIPTILFRRTLARFKEQFATAKSIDVELFDLIAYPLSGGFRRWSILPANTVRPLLRLESSLAKWLTPLMAFRMLVVIKRK